MDPVHRLQLSVWIPMTEPFLSGMGTRLLEIHSSFKNNCIDPNFLCFDGVSKQPEDARLPSKTDGCEVRPRVVSNPIGPRDAQVPPGWIGACDICHAMEKMRLKRWNTLQLSVSFASRRREYPGLRNGTQPDTFLPSCPRFHPCHRNPSSRVFRKIRKRGIRSCARLGT